jgi:hypothetical protein
MNEDYSLRLNLKQKFVTPGDRKKRPLLMPTNQPIGIEYIPITENDFLPIHYKMLLDETIRNTKQ